MNIKITKEDHERLLKWDRKEFIIGSKLYGTDDQKSDTDILCIYDPPKYWQDAIDMTNVNHQFQYDDVENNTQYIWTTFPQFTKNFMSGDLTVNADVSMFYIGTGQIELVRTYKIMKAYLGLAKRDLKKPNGKNKLFHAARGLYCVEELLNRSMPTLGGIKALKDQPHNVDVLKELESTLRKELNDLHDKGEIPMYFIPSEDDLLLNTLLQSKNIKEFKYD